MICLFPLATVTFVTINEKPDGKVMLIVSVETMEVDSLKLILAVPRLLMAVELMENPALVRLPAVIPVILTLVQISILPEVADIVSIVKLPWGYTVGGFNTGDIENEKLLAVAAVTTLVTIISTVVCTSTDSVKPQLILIFVLVT